MGFHRKFIFRTVVFFAISGIVHSYPQQRSNVRDYVPEDADIYIEIAPLQKLTGTLKEFFFHLLPENDAGVQWEGFQTMFSTKFGLNVLNPMELAEAGFDTQRASALVIQNVESFDDAVFVSLLPATDAERLYKNIFQISGKRWEEKNLKEKTGTEVYELETGKIALIDPFQKIYLLHGPGFIILSNHIETAKGFLERQANSMSSNSDFKRLASFYISHKKSEGIISTMFQSSAFLESQRKTPLNQKWSKKQAYGALFEANYQADLGPSLSVLHAGKTGVKIFNIHDESKVNQKLKNTFQRSPFLSKLDRSMNIPFFYAKLQYNHPALLRYFDKLNIPARKAFNSLLEHTMAPYTTDPFPDASFWLHSNLSFILMEPQVLSKSNPKKDWSGSVSVELTPDSRSKFLAYVQTMEKAASEDTNHEVKHSKNFHTESWRFITVSSEDPKGSDGRHVFIQLLKDEAIISFGDKPVSINFGPVLIRKLSPGTDYRRVFSYMHIQLHTILEKLKKEQFSLVFSHYWMYMQNLGRFYFMEYSENNHIVSHIEIKLKE